MKLSSKESFLCSMMLMFGTIQCYTLDDITRLKQMLFTGYDKGIRPIQNQSNPIEVYVRMYIQSIIQFDLSNGQLDTIGYMIASWKDEKMAWYGTEFEEIPSIGLDGNDLWHPSLAQTNSMADEVQLDSIALFQDGSVARAVVRKFYTFCDLNMRYFPTDRHDCTYEFLSMKYPFDQVRLMPEINGVSQVYLTKHGEWDISSTSSFTRHATVEDLGLETETLVYKFVLERQPSFNVLHRSVPLCIIAVCVLFVHMVPLNSGERTSYAVTLLLSIIFWQALVAEEMPKNSAQISIFSMVITGFLFVTGGATVASVILCRIATFESERPIPRMLQRLAFRFRPKRKGPQKFQRQFSTLSSDIYGITEDKYGPSHAHTNLPANSNMMKVNRSTSSHSEEFMENPHPVSWLEAANAIDILLFFIHLTAFLLSSVVYVLIFFLS